jgi:hypothetical protein
MRNGISGLTVTFTPPVMVSNREISELIIIRVIDEPGKRIARAMINGFRTLVLWQGDEYTNAGQWTDTDVINRVREILTS